MVGIILLVFGPEKTVEAAGAVTEIMDHLRVGVVLPAKEVTAERVRRAQIERAVVGAARALLVVMVLMRLMVEMAEVVPVAVSVAQR